MSKTFDRSLAMPSCPLFLLSRIGIGDIGTGGHGTLCYHFARVQHSTGSCQTSHVLCFAAESEQGTILLVQSRGSCSLSRHGCSPQGQYQRIQVLILAMHSPQHHVSRHCSQDAEKAQRMPLARIKHSEKNSITRIASKELLQLQ